MANILGTNVSLSSYDHVIEQTLRWVQNRESRSLIFANVHVLMEAYDDAAYRAILRSADLVNPDGVPLVWAMKLLGERSATRVYGPDCTLTMLKAAAEHQIPVGFYGGSQTVLEELLHAVARRFPGLIVSFAHSPPFRALTQEEDAAIVSEIVSSGARILFVGLGCPKQERWMANHINRLPLVMYGVGAAFDFIAGSKNQAPLWMRRNGLEWVFRLATEPTRLARRYLHNNPRFVFYFTRQILSRTQARTQLP
jgi:N-acetylglucosaminyldiphosphoundecaprenol N-acetyl-beta-D-mannosaminyltransferase